MKSRTLKEWNIFSKEEKHITDACGNIDQSKTLKSETPDTKIDII